ncbi:MAG TPA: ABC-F family ATP-binding cassette domain-containing protein [Hyphomicrobiaceae bacterium]|nr:ABC-F family ATP-binding cassette domain-containing protein [Hyphomicrobiaceae bacterium]
MLHINDLTYRIDGRVLLDRATVGIPAGHKVGLIGRNGAGKTTLLRLITNELSPDDGAIGLPRTASIGYVAQEAPGGDATLIEWVLEADKERAGLLAEAETATDPQRIGDIHDRLVDIRAHAAPARAAQILAGLGFDEAAQNRPCREYSGGWRMRVALAAVLFLEPELLLLDEPTNYLDLEGTMWLESYLKAYPHTILMVSHDRNLLNRAVTSILHLDRGRLTLYTGGYDDFEETRREQQRLEGKLKKKQDDERRRIEAFIDRFRAKATKATQAQSRIKTLARMQPIAAQVDDRVVPIQFPKPKKALASPLIRLEGVDAGYEPDKPILSKLDLRIDNDDRIALLGQNGNGKSTFAKLISGRLLPQRGTAWGHKQLSFGYFAQHQLDELRPERTPFDYMTDLMPDSSESQRRARLGAAGFGIEKSNNRCNTLSGGEKARLLLMLATFHAPHILVLDEPTNHLDVDSRETLIRALNEYEGAVILISHDRHLVEACADRLWLVHSGTVTPFDGDMADYQRRLLEERGARPAREEKSAAAKADDRAARAEQRRQAAELRAQIAPLRRTMAAAEAEVARITAKIAVLDEKLADTEIYTRDPDTAQKFSIERGLLAKSLATAEDKWLAATEAFENASRLEAL